ncbi:hypothetical protein [Nocardia salmonicida]
MPLPQRTPMTNPPKAASTAPPEIIRRLLAALDAWEPKRRTS